MCWRYLATAQPALCCENCSCCTGNPVVPTLPCVLRARSFTLSAWTAEEGRASSGGKSGAPEETHIRNKPGSGALWPLLPSALLLCSHSSCSSSCPALLSSHRCPDPHLHLSSTTESYPPCDVQIRLLSLLPGSESFCSFAICFLPIFLLFWGVPIHPPSFLSFGSTCLTCTQHDSK